MRPLDFFSKLKQGLSFWLKFEGPLIFAAYPDARREREGLFQRVLAVDKILEKLPRIYVDHIFPAPELPWWERVEGKEGRLFILRVSGGFMRKNLLRAAVWLLALRTRRCYWHTVWQMNLSRFGWIFKIPFVKSYFDVHGVVTEECRGRRDFYHATLFDPWEKLAAEKAVLTIVVTENLAEYFRKKYRAGAKSPFLTLPIMPEMEPDESRRPSSPDGRPRCLYAGSLDEWQLAAETLALMAATRAACDHSFFCPQPERAAALAPADFVPGRDFRLESKRHHEIVEALPNFTYGFVLRDDTIVNNVACPTKLSEYLAAGVIPVMRTAEVGDFARLGLRYVKEDDFRAARLPNEAEQNEMRTANAGIYRQLRNLYRENAMKLLEELRG